MHALAAKIYQCIGIETLVLYHTPRSRIGQISLGYFSGWFQVCSASRALSETIEAPPTSEMVKGTISVRMTIHIEFLSFVLT